VVMPLYCRGTNSNDSGMQQSSNGSHNSEVQPELLSGCNGVTAEHSESGGNGGVLSWRQL